MGEGSEQTGVGPEIGQSWVPGSRPVGGWEKLAAQAIGPGLQEVTTEAEPLGPEESAQSVGDHE